MLEGVGRGVGGMVVGGGVEVGVGVLWFLFSGFGLVVRCICCVLMVKLMVLLFMFCVFYRKYVGVGGLCIMVIMVMNCVLGRIGSFCIDVFCG